MIYRHALILSSYYFGEHISKLPGHVAQSVMCLVTDGCLTADPVVACWISAHSHTFMEIDHEIISTVILLPSAESFKKSFCQLQVKVCALSTVVSYKGKYVHEVLVNCFPRKKCG